MHAYLCVIDNEKQAKVCKIDIENESEQEESEESESEDENSPHGTFVHPDSKKNLQEN